MGTHVCTAVLGGGALLWQASRGGMDALGGAAEPGPAAFAGKRREPRSAVLVFGSTGKLGRLVVQKVRHPVNRCLGGMSEITVAQASMRRPDCGVRLTISICKSRYQVHTSSITIMSFGAKAEPCHIEAAWQQILSTAAVHM